MAQEKPPKAQLVVLGILTLAGMHLMGIELGMGHYSLVFGVFLGLLVCL